jgi:hypothetical protein
MSIVKPYRKNRIDRMVRMRKKYPAHPYHPVNPVLFFVCPFSLSIPSILIEIPID